MSAKDSESEMQDALAQFASAQADAFSTLFGALPQAAKPPSFDWAQTVTAMQAMLAGQGDGLSRTMGEPARNWTKPAKWAETAQAALVHLPLADPAWQQSFWTDALDVMQRVLANFDIGASAPADGPDWPRSDRRFAAEQWRETPAFALAHQLYLLFAERLERAAQDADGDLDEEEKSRLLLATHSLVQMMSPANFPLTNPVALDRATRTQGRSLVEGFANLLADIGRGQVSHTAPDAFVVGETLAATPGKVVHKTPLFELIQYAPTTGEVLETPLLIFPPWINRFYILDLDEKKSMVRWLLDQGVTVFMVSWKSADASLAHVLWDDYIAAQIEAIDVVKARLKVPAVHTVGYCVAGTTLAATLAILARRGDAEKVASATFFTAQVDFSESGDLRSFIDDAQLAAIDALTQDGVIDGRYLAATFNMLRPRDLVWPYVENSYLKGEAPRDFDLLFWNGDTTNLPAAWHKAYLRDLYRDNLLVEPNRMEALGEPIDLSLIETPIYVQAGREDHIAPPASVWKLSQATSGEVTFLLAGSGHIAGVVNPPAAQKYQYWTNSGDPQSLAEFVDGAEEHPGSWWPHWLGWLEAISPRRVTVKGKRKLTGKADLARPDAPGDYVRAR